MQNLVAYNSSLSQLYQAAAAIFPFHHHDHQLSQKKLSLSYFLGTLPIKELLLLSSLIMMAMMYSHSINFPLRWFTVYYCIRIYSHMTFIYICTYVSIYSIFFKPQCIHNSSYLPGLRPYHQHQHAWAYLLAVVEIVNLNLFAYMFNELNLSNLARDMYHQAVAWAALVDMWLA